MVLLAVRLRDVKEEPRNWLEVICCLELLGCRRKVTCVVFVYGKLITVAKQDALI
jgi:hypothetical protein